MLKTRNDHLGFHIHFSVMLVVVRNITSNQKKLTSSTAIEPVSNPSFTSISPMAFSSSQTTSRSFCSNRRLTFSVWTMMSRQTVLTTCYLITVGNEACGNCWNTQSQVWQQKLSHVGRYLSSLCRSSHTVWRRYLITTAQQTATTTPQ